MKKYILIILSLATIISCIKTLDFDEKSMENPLVLNSIIRPDSVFSASVIESTTILNDKQNGRITDGTLELYENGTLLTSITSSTGLFRSADIKPKAGKSYQIVVTSNGKQIEAETNIPNKAEVISIDTSTVKGEYGKSIINYKVRIKDPDGNDFYRITVLNESLGSSYNYKKKKLEYIRVKSRVDVITDDLVFNSLYNSFGDNAIDYGPNNEFRIFPDDYFQGKEYSVQFKLPGYATFSDDLFGWNTYYDRYTIHVQKISKDLYNYLKYLKLYHHYHEDPFAEPVPVYSNVKNGTGIFAGFNNDSKFIYEKINKPILLDTIEVTELNYDDEY